MSSPSVPTPPPQPSDWDPPIPTEGPLAGPRPAAAPVMENIPIAAQAPSRGGRFVPIAIAILVVVAIGVVAKFTLLDSKNGGGAPSAAEVDEAFTPVPGLEYVEPPASAMDEFKSIIKSDPVVADGVEEFDVRAVNQGGQPVGAVVIFGVDPDLMEGAFREDFAGGFQQSLPGSTLTQTTIDGVSVTEVSMPLGAAAFFFDESDGLIFMVQGFEQTVTKRLTKGLIKGNL
jgi:hypothetical protein